MHLPSATNQTKRAITLAHANGHLASDAVAASVSERMRFRDDHGDVTPRTIMVFIFAALALAVGGIITGKVTGKANAIQVD